MSSKICCICHDTINQGEQYTNPECQHDDFHTGCIVQWYRAGSPRCPLCNDMGETTIDDILRRPSEIIKIAKQTARKKGSDPLLKDLCDRLNEKEQEIKIVRSDIKKLKNEIGRFGDMWNKQHRMWNKHHKIIYQREAIIRSICVLFPVTKLIIVTKK